MWAREGSVGTAAIMVCSGRVTECVCVQVYIYCVVRLAQVVAKNNKKIERSEEREGEEEARAS